MRAAAAPAVVRVQVVAPGPGAERASVRALASALALEPASVLVLEPGPEQVLVPASARVLVLGPVSRPEGQAPVPASQWLRDSELR